MNQDKQERIKACLKELATLLYEEADINLHGDAALVYDGRIRS